MRVCVCIIHGPFRPLGASRVHSGNSGSYRDAVFELVAYEESNMDKSVIYYTV